MKPCYPSLFPNSGFNDITKEQIFEIFVEPFESSVRRVPLATKLREYIDAIGTITAQYGINVEIWIDGSFSTEKVDPDDVDIVVAANGQEIDSISLMHQQQLEVLLNNNFTKVNYNCDVYFSDINRPENRSYWRGWFLFDREETPKGVARIRL